MALRLSPSTAHLTRARAPPSASTSARRRASQRATSRATASSSRRSRGSRTTTAATRHAAALIEQGLGAAAHDIFEGLARALPRGRARRASSCSRPSRASRCCSTTPASPSTSSARSPPPRRCSGRAAASTPSSRTSSATSRVAARRRAGANAAGVPAPIRAALQPLARAREASARAAQPAKGLHALPLHDRQGRGGDAPALPRGRAPAVDEIDRRRHRLDRPHRRDRRVVRRDGASTTSGTAPSPTRATSRSTPRPATGSSTSTPTRCSCRGRAAAARAHRPHLARGLLPGRDQLHRRLTTAPRSRTSRCACSATVPSTASRAASTSRWRTRCRPTCPSGSRHAAPHRALRLPRSRSATRRRSRAATSSCSSSRSAEAPTPRSSRFNLGSEYLAARRASRRRVDHFERGVGDARRPSPAGRLWLRADARRPLRQALRELGAPRRRRTRSADEGLELFPDFTDLVFQQAWSRARRGDVSTSRAPLRALPRAGRRAPALLADRRLRQLPAADRCSPSSSARRAEAPRRSSRAASTSIPASSAPVLPLAAAMLASGASRATSWPPVERARRPSHAERALHARHRALRGRRSREAAEAQFRQVLAAPAGQRSPRASRSPRRCSRRAATPRPPPRPPRRARRARRRGRRTPHRALRPARAGELAAAAACSTAAGTLLPARAPSSSPPGTRAPAASRCRRRCRRPRRTSARPRSRRCSASRRSTLSRRCVPLYERVELSAARAPRAARRDVPAARLPRVGRRRVDRRVRGARPGRALAHRPRPGRRRSRLPEDALVFAPRGARARPRRMRLRAARDEPRARRVSARALDQPLHRRPRRCNSSFSDERPMSSSFRRARRIPPHAPASQPVQRTQGRVGTYSRRNDGLQHSADIGRSRAGGTRATQRPAQGAGFRAQLDAAVNVSTLPASPPASALEDMHKAAGSGRSCERRSASCTSTYAGRPCDRAGARPRRERDSHDPGGARARGRELERRRSGSGTEDGDQLHHRRASRGSRPASTRRRSSIS